MPYCILNRFALKPTQTLPRFPTLAINLGEHTCCLYASAPIPLTEWNPDIPFRIASVAPPSRQKTLAYWGYR